MTNLRRWNKAQAEDPKLLSAIKIDLKNSLAQLRHALKSLEEAEVAIKQAAVIFSDFSASLSGVPRAKYDTHSAIKHVKARIAELEAENLDDYASTVAGYMTETEVREKLKEHD